MNEKANVTLPAKVEKIVSPLVPDEKEKAQVKVEGADPLYQELRIDNSLQTPGGEEVRLKEGAEVEVTVHADRHAVSKS
jgi:hypothetical protein